jgi:hypothetical protein
VKKLGPEEKTVEEGAFPTATPLLSNDWGENIVWMRARNFDVDDDNDPAPENISTPNAEQADGIY